MFIFLADFRLAALAALLSSTRTTWFRIIVGSVTWAKPIGAAAINSMALHRWCPAHRTQDSLRGHVVEIVVLTTITSYR